MLTDIHEVIREAYHFLCLNYNHDDNNNEDEIHLIGFSRGAFAVRALACFIGDVGILKRRYLSFFSYVYRSWRLAKKDYDLAEETDKAEMTMKSFNKILKEFADKHILKREINIKSCAVWDTVSSLNKPIPNVLNIPKREKIMMSSSRLKWVGNEVPKRLDHAFQALALNEGSPEYMPVLWNEKTKGDTKVKQCWFRGNHSDIGGGYPDSGLANLTLLWMVAKFKESVEHIKFDHEALKNIMTPMSLRWEINSIKSWNKLARASKTVAEIDFTSWDPVAGMYSQG